VLTALIATSASTARAAELVHVDGGDVLPAPFVLEGKGFYKPYASWLGLPQGLVDGANDIESDISAAKAQLPPDIAAKIPSTSPLPQQIGLNTNTLRLEAVARLGDTLELDAAYQISAVIASDPRFAAAGTATTFLGGNVVTAQRRLIDLDPILLSEGGFVLEQNLDQLALAYHGTAFSLVVGRQVVSWGTGRLWNPTDLFSPFAPTDVDREVRRGADAVRLSLPLGAVSEMELLWLPQQKLVDNGGVVRLRGNVLGVDFSGSAAKYVDDLVLGADFAADVGPIGVHGEGAWTVPLVGLDGSTTLHSEGNFVRAVAGASARPFESLVVVAEYYYNGFGTTEANEIVPKLKSDRVVRGEIFGAGQHYLGTVAVWSATDLLSLTGTAILNVTDPSALLAPSLEYSLTQDVLVRAGGTIPIGLGVDAASLSAITPLDVLTNSAAFKSATTSFGARSEFGLSPWSVWLQVGVYFG
jgi:hypothetical protein